MEGRSDVAANAGKPSDGHESTVREESQRKRRRRIVVADDDRVILNLIQALLAGTYDIVAQVSDGGELLLKVAEQNPEIAIVDISMPSLNGIEATRALTATHAGVKVIMLSIHDEFAYVEAAFKAGALGYVLKLAAGRELIPAIESVASDRRYLSADLR